MAYPGIAGTAGNSAAAISPIGQPQRITIPSVLTTGAVTAPATRSLTIPNGATSAILTPDALIYYTLSNPPIAPTVTDFQAPAIAQLELETLSAMESAMFAADVAVNTTAQITVQFFG